MLSIDLKIKTQRNGVRSQKRKSMKYFVIRSKGLEFRARRVAMPLPATRRRSLESNLRKTVLLVVILAIMGCSDKANVSTGRSLGAVSSVGNGTVSSYAEFDENGTPKAIGVVFQASALDGLPTAHSDGHHCFDRNKDGKIDPETECLATHEWVIPLPSEAARRSELPFKWVGLN